MSTHRREWPPEAMLLIAAVGLSTLLAIIELCFIRRDPDEE
jgi:hypothetical protein